MKREELIKYIKDDLYKTSTYDIEKALQRIEHSSNVYELNRKEVERAINVSEDKLFDVSIEDAITYLKTFNGKHRLEQRWSGYEDNYFVVVSNEVENDEEYAYRIARLVSEVLKNIDKENKEIEQKKQQIAQLEKKLQELKKGL